MIARATRHRVSLGVGPDDEFVLLAARCQKCINGSSFVAVMSSLNPGWNHSFPKQLAVPMDGVLLALLVRPRNSQQSHPSKPLQCLQLNEKSGIYAKRPAGMKTSGVVRSPVGQHLLNEPGDA